jgi:hypothetical protein
MKRDNPIISCQAKKKGVKSALDSCLTNRWNYDLVFSLHEKGSSQGLSQG